MRRALQGFWAIVIWVFALMIPIQFYLAGHGAMEGAYTLDKKISPMKSAWDAHAGFGSIMLLVALLALLAVAAARPPRTPIIMTVLLFVFMVVQFLLPFANDSPGLRWVAAFHPVNALIVTGLAVGLAIRSWPYLPFTSGPLIRREGVAETA